MSEVTQDTEHKNIVQKLHSYRGVRYLLVAAMVASGIGVGAGADSVRRQIGNVVDHLPGLRVLTGQQVEEAGQAQAALGQDPQVAQALQQLNAQITQMVNTQIAVRQQAGEGRFPSSVVFIGPDEDLMNPINRDNLNGFLAKWGLANLSLQLQEGLGFTEDQAITTLLLTLRNNKGTAFYAVTTPAALNELALADADIHFGDQYAGISNGNTSLVRASEYRLEGPLTLDCTGCRFFGGINGSVIHLAGAGQEADISPITIPGADNYFENITIVTPDHFRDGSAAVVALRDADGLHLNGVTVMNESVFAAFQAQSSAALQAAVEARIAGITSGSVIQIDGDNAVVEDFNTLTSGLVISGVNPVIHRVNISAASQALVLQNADNAELETITLADNGKGLVLIDTQNATLDGVAITSQINGPQDQVGLQARNSSIGAVDNTYIAFAPPTSRADLAALSDEDLVGTLMQSQAASRLFNADQAEPAADMVAFAELVFNELKADIRAVLIANGTQAAQINTDDALRTRLSAIAQQLQISPLQLMLSFSAGTTLETEGKDAVIDQILAIQSRTNEGFIAIDVPSLDSAGNILALAADGFIAFRNGAEELGNADIPVKLGRDVVTLESLEQRIALQQRNANASSQALLGGGH